MFVVAFLTLALLYAVYEVIHFESPFRIVRALLIGLVASGALFNVRFYVPAFVFAAAATWGVLNGRALVRGIILGASIIGGMIFLWSGRTSLYLLEPQLLLYGIVRIFLTPRPWGTTIYYTYLEPTMWLHWLTIPALIAGLVYLQLEFSKSTILVVFGIVILVFYAIFPELQGPRHRDWIFFLFGWGLFHFVWNLHSQLRFVA